MELRQLRYLVALADEGQFTRAAAREHVAQPALSQQIARLERTLGTQLVLRSARRSTLTEAGEVVAARARRILSEVEAAHAELAELAGLRSGRVAIGAMQTLGPFDLTGVLAAFRRRYPGVELAVREEMSSRLAELLRGDQLDLAFFSVTEHFDRDGLELVKLGTEELVAVLPPEHPHAGRDGLAFAELEGEQFVSFSEGAALRQMLFDAAAAAGFEPRITVESNEIPRIRTMVSRGLGVALLPASDVAAPGPPIAVQPLTRPAMARDVTLAWRSERRLSPAANAFLELVRAEAGAADEEAG
jgi:LysR family transcriptional regulator, transcription activator of glutamate synthase operon